MPTWVALLRGVNVGGVTVRSADLAEVFRALGFDAVRTVLASGNAVFDTDVDTSARAALAARIERALAERFSYDARIILVTRDEVAEAIAAFPFDAADDERQPWVIFCADSETQRELLDEAAALDATRDPVAAGPGVVFWNPVKGTSTDSPFAKILARRTFRPRTTNRNTRTLQKIIG